MRSVEALGDRIGVIAQQRHGAVARGQNAMGEPLIGFHDTGVQLVGKLGDGLLDLALRQTQSMRQRIAMLGDRPMRGVQSFDNALGLLAHQRQALIAGAKNIRRQVRIGVGQAGGQIVAERRQR